MAEIEIGNMNQQCLDRQLPNKKSLKEEFAYWQTKRNNQKSSIKWMFDVDSARSKLHRAYDNLNGQN